MPQLDAETNISGMNV